MVAGVGAPRVRTSWGLLGKGGRGDRGTVDEMAAGLRHRPGSGTSVLRNVRDGTTRPRVGTETTGPLAKRAGRGRRRRDEVEQRRALRDGNRNEGDASPPPPRVATVVATVAVTRTETLGRHRGRGSLQRGPNETELSGERSESAAAPR